MVDGEGLMSRRIGEVVGAAPTSFLSQCYTVYEAPPLGSLVRTDSPTLYGVVCHVSTEPLDPGRPVLARGESAATEAEIFQNNPQLTRLFTTRFEALITGHNADGLCKQYLPPLPPAVHSFVFVCSPAEVTEFTAQLDFLPLLLNSGSPVADEVAAYCLRRASAAQPDGPEFLARASKALAAQLASDVPRLSAILRRAAS